MDYNKKYIHAKEVAAKQHLEKKAIPSRDRLPSNQVWTNAFPVLDLGVRPEFDESSWSLKVEGEIEKPLKFSYKELLSLPRTELTADLHCVTHWSKKDVNWTGVKFKDFCKIVKVKPSARYVLQYSSDNYMTNVSLKEMLEEDVLLAYFLEGKPLPKEHGAPLRVINPNLYAWKGAKFLNRIVFAKEDNRGFWEIRGYHNHGDPWMEERYSSQE